jgi:hypothetical protein
MSARSRGTATVDIDTSTGQLRLLDVIVVDHLTNELIIGAPTLMRLATIIKASSKGFDVILRSPDVSLLTTTLGSAFRFASRADELYSRIDFAAVAQKIGRPVSAQFQSRMRAIVERLDAHRLLIGKYSPGHTQPAALRGAKHVIALRPNADLRDVHTHWRHLPRDEFELLRAHIKEKERGG